MISFPTPHGRFNYRVAGVAIRDDRVLIHRDVRESFWVLPGGRVELMETAVGSLTRELQEETGVTVEIGRLLWIVESFFIYQQTHHHELGLYFEFSVPSGHLTGASFSGREGAEFLEFEWYPLGKLRDLDIQPRFLAERLANLPSHTEHVIQDCSRRIS